MFLEARETKTKINSWDLIKIKSSAQQRKESGQLKGNQWNGRRYLQMTLSNKIISQIYKELIKLNDQKNNPVKKWEKDMNRHFSKEDIQWLTDT